MNNSINIETAIRALVKSNVVTYAQTFSERHIVDRDNENGTINMKIHNIFISMLGAELQYYSAIVRSFDSSLGNMLENLAISIAGLHYEVRTEVSGPLYQWQTGKIAELLEGYKNSSNPIKPDVSHYSLLNKKFDGISDIQEKRHVSDYYIIDKSNNKHYLIELKIGGDLDNKKARSEKEALFEQYAILNNTLPEGSDVKCFFATAYNRFGEGKEWKQGRVKQFFSNEELLIGRDFWNFICNSESGYDIIMDEYGKNAQYIKDALAKIKSVYLSDNE